MSKKEKVIEIGEPYLEVGDKVRWDKPTGWVPRSQRRFIGKVGIVESRDKQIWGEYTNEGTKKCEQYHYYIKFGKVGDEKSIKFVQYKLEESKGRRDSTTNLRKMWL